MSRYVLSCETRLCETGKATTVHVVRDADTGAQVFASHRLSDARRERRYLSKYGPESAPNPTPAPAPVRPSQPILGARSEQPCHQCGRLTTAGHGRCEACTPPDAGLFGILQTDLFAEVSR